MHKTITKPTMTRMRLKRYLNSNRDDYVKTEKCENCKTIYVVNPESRRYHQLNKCIKLHSGYYHDLRLREETKKRQKERKRKLKK